MTTANNPAITNDVFCQTCGYNLRGLTGDRCPECGHSFQHIRSGMPEIPWMYRNTPAGPSSFRAYWQTVFFVMFRQKRFADEMARPVSFPQSQSFRWWTVAFALLAVIIAAAAPLARDLMSLSIWTSRLGSLTNSGAFQSSGGWLGPASTYPLSFTIPITLACLAGAFLMFAGITGAPSYLFYPKEVSTLQQNRAIALSYYASGPLGLLPIPAAFFTAGIAWGQEDYFRDLLLLLGLTVPIGLFIAWWLDLIHLSRRLLPQRPARAVGVALIVPMLWTLVAGLSLTVPPAIAAGISIIPQTLH